MIKVVTAIITIAEKISTERKAKDMPIAKESTLVAKPKVNRRFKFMDGSTLASESEFNPSRTILIPISASKTKPIQ